MFIVGDVECRLVCDGHVIYVEVLWGFGASTCIAPYCYRSHWCFAQVLGDRSVVLVASLSLQVCFDTVVGGEGCWMWLAQS